MVLNSCPELTDLVGTLDLNAVIQLPGADARSACRERPDGPHHAPRKGDGEAQGHDQADRGDPQRARQRAAPGFVGLTLGQLDEHAPVHRWRGRLRHQDRLPLQAGEPMQYLDRLRVDQAQGRREVGVAQHQAGIGVRDQAPRLVDHVRLAVAADTQLRDDIADKLQVHFCHHDTSLASGGGECHADERLGIATKVDRAVVRAVRQRGLHRLFLRTVDTAVQPVHADA